MVTSLCGQDLSFLVATVVNSMNVNSSKLWFQVCHGLIMTCDQLSDLCYQSYTQAGYLDSLVPSWSFSFVFTVITQWKNEKCEVDTRWM